MQLYRKRSVPYHTDFFIASVSPAYQHVERIQYIFPRAEQVE
jgi:hypothetical protein